VREDEHEGWGEPPPFCFVRSSGNYRTTKFRSFSPVYPIRPRVWINRWDATPTPTGFLRLVAMISQSFKTRHR